MDWKQPWIDQVLAGIPAGSCRGRMEAELRTWARGCAVMFGVQLLVSCLLSCVWQMALSLPGDSQEPWVRLIRGTVGGSEQLLALDPPPPGPGPDRGRIFPGPQISDVPPPGGADLRGTVPSLGVHLRA